MKLFYLAMVLAICSATANATTYYSTLTADNHYAVYVGSAIDGSGMTYITRNELGFDGDPGQYNWSLPENFFLNVADDQAIYIAAWSDDSVAQGLLGQFCVSNSDCVLTGSEWQVMITSANLGDGSAAPTPLALQLELQGGTWISPLLVAHGEQPWGYVPGISTSANWIWGSSLTPGSAAGEFQIFCYGCTTEVPEPASMLLFGLGAAGLTFLRRRR